MSVLLKRGGGGQYTIDVAEATGFALLRVVQSSCPVDCDVAFVSAQTCRALCCASVRNKTQVSYGTKDNAPMEPPAEMEQ